MMSLRGFLESHPLFYSRIPDDATHAYLDEMTWWCEVTLQELDDGTVLCPTVTLEVLDDDTTVARFELIHRCPDEGLLVRAPLPFRGDESALEDVKSELIAMGFDAALAESDEAQAMQAFVQMLRDWMGDRVNYVHGRNGG